MKLLALSTFVSALILFSALQSAPGQSRNTTKARRISLITENASKGELESYYKRLFVVSSTKSFKIRRAEFCIVQAVNSPGVVISDVLLYVKQGGKFRLMATFWHRYGTVNWRFDEKPGELVFSYTETKLIDRIRLDFGRL